MEAQRLSQLIGLIYDSAQDLELIQMVLPHLGRGNYIIGR